MPRKLRSPKVHQPRNRRARLGELVQIDGSDHAWFEEQAISGQASGQAVVKDGLMVDSVD